MRLVKRTLLIFSQNVICILFILHIVVNIDTYYTLGKKIKNMAVQPGGELATWSEGIPDAPPASLT